jgi:valyl-tRNA synthetase
LKIWDGTGVYQKEQLPIDPAEREGFSSLHRSTWPEPDDKLIDDETEATGDNIVQIATAVRRFKSARNLSLATNLNDLYLITSNPNMSALLEEAKVDIISITRASRVTMTHEPVPGSESILSEEDFQVAVKL